MKQVAKHFTYHVVHAVVHGTRPEQPLFQVVDACLTKQGHDLLSMLWLSECFKLCALTTELYVQPTITQGWAVVGHPNKIG